MKTNEAPEKIYITNYDIEALPKDEQLSERWYEVSTQDTDIEYTRTDAFVEKAREWFERQYEWYDKIGVRHCDMKSFEDFKAYMGGE